MRTIAFAALAALVRAAAVGAQGSGAAPLDSIAPPAALAVPVSIHASNQPLRVVVAELAREGNVSIVFDPSLASFGRSVSASFDRVPIAKAILRLLDGSDVRATMTQAGSIVLTEAPKRDERRAFVGGVVRQGAEPLEAVRLVLVGTRFETISDASGRFTFGLVPVGTYVLRALRMGFAPIAQVLRVGGGDQATPIALVMTPAAVPVDAVIVTPGYVGVMQAGLAQGQTLTRQQIETVPQLGEDVYRMVGRLPGVSTEDFSANFTIRGEPSQALYVTLDGLPLVEPFHLRDLGSALSIVDLAALGHAELIAGGPSAEYGDQIAGVFNLHSVEARRDRPRTSVGVSITNVRAMSQGGFAGGKGAWLVSARRGFLDLALKLANLQDSLKPRYSDVFAKVTYDVPGGGQLGVHLLRAGDRLHYLESFDPSIDSRYTSSYYWLTLDGRVGSRLRHQSVAWTDRLDWARRGYNALASQPLLDIHDTRTLRGTGARSDWSIDLGSRALLKIGGETRHDAASYDYSKLYRRNLPVNGGVVLTTDSSALALDPSGDVVGAYIAQRLRPFESFTFETGVRYDRATHTGDSYVSPRVNASWRATQGTTVRAAWGIHSQSQTVFDLQVENGVRTFQPAERSRQVSVGLEQIVGGGVVARVEAYDKSLDRVWSRYATAATRVQPFTEVDHDLAFFAPTRGEASGVELTVEREGGRNVDWSASYVRSSTREELSGAWVPRPADQPNALRTDWSFHPASNAWRLSLSGMRHTGHPFTPEVVRLDTVKTGNQTSIYVTRSPGALYSLRTDPYTRFDARFTRFIDTGSGRFSFFVDIYNVLNNANERERLATVNFNTSRATFGEESRFNLPRIPSFGINWEF